MFKDLNLNVELETTYELYQLKAKINKISSEDSKKNEWGGLGHVKAGLWLCGPVMEPQAPTVALH